MKTPHRVCDACGMYRGKKVLKIKAEEAEKNKGN
jgi:hypothetical protein